MRYTLSKNGRVLNLDTNREMWCYAHELVEMFDMYESGQFTLKEIGKKFYVTEGTIRNTIKESWCLKMLVKQLKTNGKYRWEDCIK